MSNFWSLVDCLTGSLTSWNASSGTATKIYNAMNTAKTNGLSSVDVFIQSGNSKQGELTVRTLKQLGYTASVVPWENNQLRISISWEP